MYKSLRSLLRLLIPKKLLFKWEPSFRSVFYKLSYSGNNYQCGNCNRGLKAFVQLENGNIMCPACGSVDRTRRMWQLLNNGLLNEGITVLDFSPARDIYRLMRKQKGINYFSTDLSGEFIADYNYDITNIDAVDNKFDLIICYHILEHIIDDIKAMQELYRVLKPKGHILVQTPFKEGKIYEDYTISSSEDRLKHFGQDDHVRIYSVEGLKNRLISVGFTVEVLSYNDEPNNINGLKNNEHVLLLSK